MERKERAPKLPKTLLKFKSPDKDWLDRDWYKGRDELDFPYARIILCGPPSSGKNLICNNILCRTKFDQVVVWTYDKKSREFDSIDHIRVHGPPPEELFSPEVRSCLILDDVNLSALKKDEQQYMERITGALSSHRNITLIFMVQDVISSIPSCMRRNFNVFFVFRGADLRSLEVINSRVGLKKGSLQNIFKFIANQPGDSIRIDLTPGSPLPLALNGYQKLEDIDYSKEK